MLANVKLEDNQSKIHFLTMFTNWILSIIKTKEGNIIQEATSDLHDD